MRARCLRCPGNSSTVIESSGEGSSAASSALNAFSLRFSSALKVVEQTPQRTSPCATRSASAVTRKTVAQSGHWVYTPTPRRRRPARRVHPSRSATGPISNHGRYACATSAACGSSRPARTNLAARLGHPCEAGSKLGERTRQDVREHDVEEACDLTGTSRYREKRREPVFQRVLARSQQMPADRCRMRWLRPAPSLSAASARMPEPQP